ncbi:SAM-dependent methyltransferase [Undibacterium sp. Ji50W]|uniref:SAM-dependent methyltransferase n=1 Tax=Undibacterium sp. Ji50W TaxID=3413041 RepID=UPI003BF2F1B7
MELASSKSPKGKISPDGSILSSPAIRALFVQCIALLLSYILYNLDKEFFAASLSPYLILVAHSLFAVLISIMLRLQWWWWLIEFFFPYAVVASLVYQLSPGYSLLIFVLMVLLFWSTYRTQVPYFPSKSSLLPCILEQMPTMPGLRFIDVGSGFGGLSLNLSRARPEQHFYGVEIAPFPWLASWIRARFSSGSAEFFLGNYLALDFAGFDLIFAYLSPAAMPALWEKAQAEMKKGALLMSYEFPIPGIEADLQIKSGANDPVLYVWRI